MAIANSSETQLALVGETAWGATPADPAFQRLRFTAESLGAKRQTATSNEIRPDRNVSDLIQISGSAEGDVQFEWSHGLAGSWIDCILESALFGRFSDNLLKNGTDQRSLTVEKRFSAGAQDIYLRLRGLVVNQLSLEARVGQIVTGRAAFQGAGGEAASAALAGATYADAPSGDVFSAAAGFAALQLGGLAGVRVLALSLQVANNLRAQQALGSVSAVGVGSGRAQVTGSLEIYLEDKALLDLFLAGTPSSLSFVLGQASGEKYGFALPRLKLSELEAVAGGNDQDVIYRAQFQALFDPASGCTLEIARAVA